MNGEFRNFTHLSFFEFSDFFLIKKDAILGLKHKRGLSTKFYDLNNNIQGNKPGFLFGCVVNITSLHFYEDNAVATDSFPDGKVVSLLAFKLSTEASELLLV